MSIVFKCTNHCSKSLFCWRNSNRQKVWKKTRYLYWDPSLCSHRNVLTVSHWQLGELKFSSSTCAWNLTFFFFLSVFLLMAWTFRIWMKQQIVVVSREKIGCFLLHKAYDLCWPHRRFTGNHLLTWKQLSHFYGGR